MTSGTTKKARLIKQLSSLSEAEKEKITAFFTKHPVYENRIDWNNKSLQYRDFEKVFKKADASHKSIKRKIKANPEVLFEKYNCRIVSRTEDYLIVTPLDWECAVFFNSFGCGGTGAKWCIGDKNNYRHWHNYVSAKNIFYLIYFVKRHPVCGRKLLIQYDKTECDFAAWSARDNHLSEATIRKIKSKNAIVRSIEDDVKALKRGNAAAGDALSLELGRGLGPLFDKEKDGKLIEWIRSAGNQPKFDFEPVISKVRITGSELLEASEYRVKVKGVDAGRGKIDTAADPPAVIAAHLEEIIKNHVTEILDIEKTWEILDAFIQGNPALAEEILKINLTLEQIHEVFQHLLKEQVSIRNTPVILETLAKYGHPAADTRYITEKVRQALAGQLCLQYADEEKTLRVLTVAPSLEQKIIKDTAPRCREMFIWAAGQAANAAMEKGWLPAVLCSEAARFPVKSSTSRSLPGLTVLSAPEIADGFTVSVIGEIRINEAEFYLDEVKKTSWALQYVPEELKTPEVCLEAVKKRGWALDYVPEELKTAELCLEAVKDCGRALQYVPEELKTAELCLAAVKEDGWALQYVPEELRTAELCLEAVKDCGRALQYVPEELRTAELCLQAVKRNGLTLEYVPKELKTAELCLQAVKQDGFAIQHVPWGQLNLTVPAKVELCLKAVKKKGRALEYVPVELRTAKVCLEAVKKSGGALEYVPVELRTAELCLQAVKRNHRAVNYVPEELREEVCCGTKSGWIPGADPRLMFKKYRSEIISETDDFFIIIPKSRRALVFFNSSSCGGEEAKWCIGNRHSSDCWKKYINDGTLFYFVFFKNKNIFGRKIMIEYNVRNGEVILWPQENHQFDSDVFWHILKKNYTICNEDPNDKQLFLDFDNVLIDNRKIVNSNYFLLQLVKKAYEE